MTFAERLRLHTMADPGCPRGALTPWIRILLYGALVLFPIGIVLNVAGLPGRGIGWTVLPVLLLYTVIMVLSEMRVRRPHRVLGELSAIGMVVFLVEVVGVRSGFPFGRYAYTEVLEPSLWGVPLVIAGTWYTVIVSAWRIAAAVCDRSGTYSPARIAITASLITLAFDIALEPMASRIALYWIWESDSVPFGNYLSWLVLAWGISFWFAPRSRPSPGEQAPGVTATAAIVFLLQEVLFLVTNVAHGFVIPAAISVLVLLMALSPALWSRSGRKAPRRYAHEM